jgi:hypothetical protein
MSYLLEFNYYGRDILDNPAVDKSLSPELMVIVFVRPGFKPQFAIVDKAYPYYDAEKITELELFDSLPSGKMIDQVYDWFDGSNRFYERGHPIISE